MPGQLPDLVGNDSLASLSVRRRKPYESVDNSREKRPRAKKKNKNEREKKLISITHYPQ